MPINSPVSFNHSALDWYGCLRKDDSKGERGLELMSRS